MVNREFLAETWSHRVQETKNFGSWDCSWYFFFNCMFVITTIISKWISTPESTKVSCLISEQTYLFFFSLPLFIRFLSKSSDFSDFLSSERTQLLPSSILCVIITGGGCLYSLLSWLKRVDEGKWEPQKETERQAVFSQSLPRVPHLPALAFYWNIKGEADLQRHIVKPVTPITKAVKWEEDGEEEQEEAQSQWVLGEGEGGTWGFREEVKCVGDWEVVVGKSQYNKQSSFLSGCWEKNASRMSGRESYWHRRSKGCWESWCWERLRNHQGMLKHWETPLRSTHWFSNMFILSLWQFDGRVCSAE